MGNTMHIKAGSVEAIAELNESQTADSIWKILPITGKAQTWGNEIYFGIPVSLPLENGQEIVKMGDLGYWPTGKAFCIFFGFTPASMGDEIRPASAVNVFGKVTGDATIFKQVKEGTEVIIEKAETG